MQYEVQEVPIFEWTASYWNVDIRSYHPLWNSCIEIPLAVDPGLAIVV